MGWSGGDGSAAGIGRARPFVNAPAPVVTAPLARLVARNIATLGSGELISRLIGFAATIYIARTLGAEAYGIIGLALAVLLYASTAVDAGIEHTGPREVAAAQEDLTELVSTITIARLLWSFVVALVVFLIALLLFSGVERTVLALYSAALLPIGAYTRWFHLGMQRTFIVSLARVVPDVLRVLAIFALVRGPDDLIVVPLAEIAANLLNALLLLAGLRAVHVHIRPRFNATLARAVFRRALPMAASALLAALIYNVDLFFLRIFRTPQEVGLYLAGYTLLNFVGILGPVLALALVPAFTRLRAEVAERAALFGDAAAHAFAAGLPIAIGGALTAPLLIDLIFGSEFAVAAPVLAILVWLMPALLVRSVHQAGLIANGRQDLVLRTAVGAAVTNVGLNFVAVPLLGIYGAALTTLLAEFVRTFATWRFVRSEGYPQVALMRFVRSGAAGALLAAVLLLARPQTVWFALPLGVAAYGVALLLTGVIRIRDGRIVGV